MPLVSIFWRKCSKKSFKKKNHEKGGGAIGVKGRHISDKETATNRYNVAILKAGGTIGVKGSHISDKKIATM